MREPTRNPYVGPRTFSRDEAELFFGRESEAQALVSLVASERLVLFYAQSGAGKSSLINTRLIPQLEEIGFLVLPVGRVGGELPAGVEAVDNIYAFNLMLNLVTAEDNPSRLAGLNPAHFLARLTSPDGETYGYDERADPQPGDAHYEQVPYVLIIDQFEEIITAHLEHWPKRQAFFRQLNQAMAGDPLLRVVLTVREDYVAALDPYAPLLADKLQARLYMQRMAYQAALAAVKEPARRYDRPFAPGVAETLVDNLRQLRRTPDQSGTQAGQYVEPVQLQVVCYQLWENLREQQPPAQPDRHPSPPQGGTEGGLTITEQDIREAGDVDTALAQFYEQALAEAGRQTGVSEAALRNWFEGPLITEAGTRGMVYRGETETAGLPNAAVTALADQFLLRAEIRAGGTWYELVHDRFVEPIRRANQGWQTERLQRNPLMRPARLWGESGRNPDRLLSGRQLREAQAYAEASPSDVTEAEKAFLSESLRQEAATARQRRNTIVAVIIVVAVLAGLTLWALEQADRASQAEARAVAQAEIAQQNADQAATAQAIAEAEAQRAEAARQEITRQNEAAEAEIQFSQTTDPEAWLAHLLTLLERDRGSVARQLFWELPEVFQTELLTVEDERLVRVIKELYVTLADVNRSGYTDPLLEAMAEGLTGLQDASGEAKDLKAEIDQWRQARESVRKGDDKTARTEYDALIEALNGDNPATRYERAGVLAELGEYEAALADLERVMALVGEDRAFAGGRLVEGGSEFATMEQVRQTTRRLIYWVSEPEMASIFERSRASYPNLAPAGLTPTSLITDAKGVKMVLVEGGLFDMGSNQGASDERPVHKVALADFYIDQYEVTNTLYKACQDEGVCTPPRNTSSYSREDYYGNPDYDNYPVVWVDWHQARTYCEWREARLPTEAEWEKAARGTDGRTYPWGEAIDVHFANYASGDTMPVGSYPAGVSPYGAYDMAGNVGEWTQSLYEPYPYRADDGRETLDSTDVRVLRGGSWGSFDFSVRAASRGRNDPTYAHDLVGFRCVR
jgi:formylglycine-generating enzyme required for sulfatase activity